MGQEGADEVQHGVNQAQDTGHHVGIFWPIDVVKLDQQDSG